MGFLDNSGDIILDAVLTDAGRQRLAKGDGSFRITQFALGDDEINYGLYNTEHTGGSAYYDVEIMNTPVFEAFTNNIASLNSKLLSISRTDLFYLPVLKLNNKATGTDFALSSLVQNGYLLTTDENTTKKLITENNSINITFNSLPLTPKGILNGYQQAGGNIIRVDQGIDNSAIPQVDANSIPQDLKETQYFIEMDNRFMQLVGSDGNIINMSYVDDDDMAAYYVSSTNDNIVKDISSTPSTATDKVLNGANGTSVQYKLKSKDELRVNDYLFDKLGTELTSKFNFGGTTKVKSINTSVRITGMTTGYAIDVPIVILKVIS